MEMRGMFGHDNYHYQYIVRLTTDLTGTGGVLFIFSETDGSELF